jgi:DNA (cytosine-5)-methyltransferase 1
MNLLKVDSKYFLSEKAIKGINAKKEKSKLNGNGFGAQFLDPEKPSYTIPARYWKDGYDALVKYDEKTIRRLTISELKKIQSFPDNYIIKGNNKEIIMQIGNAVACKFAYHLGKYIIKILQ